MRKEKIFKRVIVLTFMFMIICGNSFTVKAASKKEKALQAYNAMLSKSSFHVKIDTWVVKYQTKNCTFALAYIDKNTIPELIVANYTDTSHASGNGAVFTYKNGKIKQVSFLSLNEFLAYYKKKGVIIDTYSGMGFSERSYEKMSNGEMKLFARTSKNFGNPGSKKKQYYDKNFNKISKRNFNRTLKKYVKAAKPVKAQFIANTAENRRQYLK